MENNSSSQTALLEKEERVTSHVLSLQEPGKVVGIKKERTIPEDWAAVEPTYTSICHADLRYFAGQRRPEALAKKLPMALLHEGIGIVKVTNSDKFQVGDRVVVVPNIPARVVNSDIEHEEGILDNYYQGGHFLGSGYDGLAQSALVHPADCLVKVPDEIPDEVAVLSELSSVSYHALSHVEDKLHGQARVALFGDGPVGYFTAAMLSHIHGVEKERFVVFGADNEKLANFDFARTENVLEYDFDKKAERFDIIIECTGGKFSASAINQAISIAAPLADIIFMGVTEELVPINTRDILEKGITARGSSRSSTKDFENVIHGMRNKNYQKALRKILPNQIKEIRNATDFSNAMHEYVKNPGWKKTVMRLNLGQEV